jgi:cell wall-associated NlpC family hydrolase
MLLAMRITATLVALLFAASAHASPPGANDDMDKLLTDKGLLARIDHVRQSVGNKASELVVTAIGFLGVPYRRGGNTAESGFDCSGFVRAMYQQSVGMLLPRKAEQQAAATEKIDRADLQPGDLVFFNTMRRAFSHVGIYVGEGKFIHSPKPGSEVRVEDMGIAYWSHRFDGARRVQTSQPETPSRQAVQAIEPAVR